MAGKITKEHEIYILVGILSIVALIVCVQFVWKPQWARWQGLKPQLARLRQDVQQVERQGQQLDNMQADTAALQTRQQQLTAQFSEQVAVDTLLQDLSAIAEETFVQIESLEPIAVQGAAPDSDGYYAEIPIQIRATGGYHQLGQFVNALERHPRLIHLVRLDIEGNPDEPWRQTARIIVSTFRLLTPASASQ